MIPRINKCSDHVEWLFALLLRQTWCSCHRLFLFIVVCTPVSIVRCESARLIPVTRGITSLAADDSVLTSLVAGLMGVNWLKFYSTQNDWTLYPASSFGTQTASAARLAAVQRLFSFTRLWFACDVGRYINSFWLIDWLWSKAFVGGLVASHPTLTAFVVRPNEIDNGFLCCITVQD